MGIGATSSVSVNPPLYYYSQPSSSRLHLHLHPPPTYYYRFFYTHSKTGRRLWMPYSRQLQMTTYSSSSFNNNKRGNGDISDCPVPLDQQPINEYQSLMDSSWASGDVVEFYSRVFATGACFGVLLGIPLGIGGSPVTLGLSCVSSGVLASLVAVFRMYLGWTYVGNRLLSATVEYEETGWYDGQVWVKSPEVLARDRLLASFSVKPVVSRLKKSLVILGISLMFMCICCALRLDLLIMHMDDDNSSIKTSYSSSVTVPIRVYSDESARNFEPDAFCGQPN